MTMPLHRKEERQHEKARRPLSIESRETVPLTQRGPMLFVDDIQHLYGKKPDGKWRRSTKWIRESFAPECRRYLGRTPFWYEGEATKWVDAQSRRHPTRREEDA